MDVEGVAIDLDRMEGTSDVSVLLPADFLQAIPRVGLGVAARYL